MKISSNVPEIEIIPKAIPKVGEISAEVNNYKHDVTNDKRTGEDGMSNKALRLKEKVRVGEYNIDMDKLGSLLLKNL
jgi:anti-sigma28 factor (negative regulator of flagellin synthesis)